LEPRLSNQNLGQDFRGNPEERFCKQAYTPYILQKGPKSRIHIAGLGNPFQKSDHRISPLRGNIPLLRLPRKPLIFGEKRFKKSSYAGIKRSPEMDTPEIKRAILPTLKETSSSICNIDTPSLNLFRSFVLIAG